MLNRCLEFVTTVRYYGSSSLLTSDSDEATAFHTYCGILIRRLFGKQTVQG